MVQVKVKKFSRSKTELPIQPDAIPDIPNNEEENEVNVEDVVNLPPVDELADLKNTSFIAKGTNKSHSDAEDILKKVINKKNVTQVESNPGEGILTKIMNRKKEKSQKMENNTHTDTTDDDDATPILGKDRRILTSKIQQYKNLFPEILGKFKLKKNPTVEDLQEALDEMEVMVNCSSVEDFLNDSILQCLKMIEGASSYTRYDVSGMSDLLRQNKQFHQLSKMLYIKYKVFSSIPPEYQMVMLMATTAYVCVEKNKRKASLEAYLNTTIPPVDTD